LALGYISIGTIARSAILKQRILLSSGKAFTTRRLKRSITASRKKAVETEMLPLARGRFFVRVTFLSNFLSHKSLAIQPAPLTKKPPIIISPRRGIGGGEFGVSQRDQQAGIRRISLPLGLFHLRRFTHSLPLFFVD
tara:strand:- start:219 stop:629 length:411 start_codon:yes stop_codon:yes gene_type:complete